ncbi:MAG: RluA family pseudouridine synthase [Candidatus Dormibacteraeota bacterium]|nr:RluA family pseudouridine synthase [Candidatus Dormibacteraeota bacterium]MBV9526456.1 RluA family pseudouridine synthase [Candidatus Dormibacteraeota bacterium]
MITVAGEQRLDVWLARERSITRHAARTLLDARLVRVNGRVAKPGQRIHPADVVEVDDAGPAEPVPIRAVEGGAPPTLDGLIVYEDGALAVIDKPAGMVVHPAPGHPAGTLADALRARGTTWSLLGGAERPGIVHRLDRDTSGLLVVAKTEAAHRSLAGQLRDRTLGRTYWAAVQGGFREDSGTVDAPVGRDPRNRKRMAVLDGGRGAVTDFRVAERIGDVTVLTLSLRTGRTHQIRVHLAYIRRPVVGDSVYGRADSGPGRLALHASQLRFSHPSDGVERTFTSHPPPELAEWIDALRAARS